MLQSVKALRGSPILARDEKFGFLLDLYFDDRRWVLRYFVADTGRPMPQRSVLLGLSSIASLDPTGGLHIALTRKQIEKLPDWLTERPVYLQHDMTPPAIPATSTCAAASSSWAARCRRATARSATSPIFSSRARRFSRLHRRPWGFP